MQKSKALYLVFCFFITIVFVQAQETTKTFTVAQLQEDFKILRYNLETAHVGLYYYTPKEELDKAFDSIAAQLEKPMTEIEFYRLLSPLLKKIGNGHTHIVPSAMYFKKRVKEDFVFPFEVYWNEDDLYVLQNNSRSTTIEEGAIIKSINGIETGKIFQHLVDNETRDGYNLTGPENDVSDGFSRRYATHYGNPATFVLAIEKESLDTVEVTALKLDEVKKIREERYGKTPAPWYKTPDNALLLDIDGKIATMTIRTFSDGYAKEAGQKFKPFFKESFTKINQARVEHLIIDMRGNGGGDPQPTIQLFSHLHDKPFTFYKDVTALVKKLPNPDYYEGEKFTVKAASLLAMRKRGDVYAVKQNMLSKLAGLSGLKESKPAKEVYKGKVYVLIDANSFSATGEMSAIIKEHNRAIFIGEETGGNPNMNISGLMPFLHLPHTQIRAVMPLWMWEMNVTFENKGRGVIPDHPIRNSIEDELSGRDAVMDYALKLIDNN